MYLNKLNIEEKKAFLGLAHLVAGANGVVDDAEKNMIAQYCVEMEITDIPSEKSSIESVISVFDNSTKVVKNIVMLELVGLCMTDGEYDTDETGVLEEIATGLGISKELINDFESDLKDYFEVVTKMTKRIFS